MTDPSTNPHGLTVPEVAERLRVGQEKVRGWIRAGELKAVNVATRCSDRPRWIVTAEALQLFERRRQVAPVAKRAKKKHGRGIDFYPD